MQKFSLKNRIQYAFDNFMARRFIALIIALGAISLLLCCAWHNRFIQKLINYFSKAGISTSSMTAFCLKLARDYVKLETPVNFYTILESARRKGETAIGYHLKSVPQTSEISMA